MRVVLADLKSNRGFVSKDTVVGGYGSRLDPFSRVTAVISYVKKQFHDVPSVHMAYLAAILERGGHEVRWTREALVDGDVAAGRSASSGRRGPSAADSRCWPAVDAPNSAPTARTASWRDTARGRSATSSRRSSGCAIRSIGRT